MDDYNQSMQTHYVQCDGVLSYILLSYPNQIELVEAHAYFDEGTV